MLHTYIRTYVHTNGTNTNFKHESSNLICDLLVLRVTSRDALRADRKYPPEPTAHEEDTQFTRHQTENNKNKNKIVIVYYRIRFNFRRVKLSRIANFHGFHIFIFTVCDVIAQALPVWSKIFAG